MPLKVSVQRPLSARKRRWFNIALVAIPVAGCLLIYLATIVWRCSAFLQRHQRWAGTVYKSDAQCGYVPMPDALAFHTLREGDRIPVRIDAEGFRVPVNAPAVQPATGGILFLGCSFTHGYGVPAEETFAQIAADRLQVPCRNAGVSGWGLAPMVLRARRDIPRIRPQYTVVQYSNWLITRSQEYYAPSDFGLVPTPFFALQSGRMDIYPPVFKSVIPELMQHSDRSSLLSFVMRIGLRSCPHDDVYSVLTSMRQGLGQLPSPAVERQAILDYALEEIRQLCQLHGSRLFVVSIRRSFDDQPQDRLDREAYSVIETFEPLATRLPERSTEAWGQRYYHWRGNPPRLVDMHPSQQAHAVIGRVIADSILRASPPSLPGRIPAIR